MTVKQIISDVKELCPEGAYTSDSLVLAALNTALNTIHSELGITARAAITPDPVRILRRISTLDHSGGIESSVEAAGVAFGFIAYGEGRVTVRDSLGEKVYSFNGHGVEIYGHLASNATLTLSGEYSYTLRDLCFFKELKNGSVPSVKRRSTYSIREHLPDFSSAVSAPQLEDGTPIEGAMIEGDAINLPSEFDMPVWISYKKRPGRITLDSTEDTLSLPSAAISALVMLAAAYATRALDSDGASFFIKEYERLKESVRRSGKSSHSGTYTDCTGWCK